MTAEKGWSQREQDREERRLARRRKKRMSQIESDAQGGYMHPTQRQHVDPNTGLTMGDRASEHYTAIPPPRELAQKISGQIGVHVDAGRWALAHAALEAGQIEAMQWGEEALKNLLPPALQRERPIGELPVGIRLINHLEEAELYTFGQVGDLWPAIESANIGATSLDQIGRALVLFGLVEPCVYQKWAAVHGVSVPLEDPEDEPSGPATFGRNAEGPSAEGTYWDYGRQGLVMQGRFVPAAVLLDGIEQLSHSLARHAQLLRTQRAALAKLKAEAEDGIEELQAETE